MELSQNDDQIPYREKLERAKAHVEAKEFEQSWKLANEVLDENFNEGAALFLLGYIALQHEQLGLAYNLNRMCSQLATNRAEPWNNMGMCFSERWGNAADLEEAERCFQEAQRREPEDAYAYNNLALVAIHKCKPHEAIRYCDEALKRKPGLIQALDNKALACLMVQDWVQGWECYESALGHIKERKERIYCDPPEPRWDGKPAKTVVLYQEQGIGDVISFASILPDALTRIEKPILEVDARLEGLFRRSFPEATVYGTYYKNEIEWPDNHKIDARIAFGSLGRLFRHKNKDFPGEPYLVADPQRRIQWRALLDSLGDKPKIGIAWTGGIPKTGTQKRSVSLESLAPLIKSVDAHWVSLQYKDPSKEIDDFEKEHGIEIHHWRRASEAWDYDETAALVAELDIVISVTTAVVHLCGALGKPCWVMAPQKPRWFYQMKGERIPWYNSIRMFRQDERGRWPVGEISKQLRNWKNAWIESHHALTRSPASRPNTSRQSYPPLAL